MCVVDLFANAEPERLMTLLAANPRYRDAVERLKAEDHAPITVGDVMGCLRARPPADRALAGGNR
jgi:hypothetical protein